MKKLIIVLALLLIVLSLTLMACEEQTVTTEKAPTLTDQEILAQHPDDLESALNDLAAVDES